MTESTQATGVGSVFVSNYPPYSAWSADLVPEARRALATPGDPATPLGLYLHIPFCRKRCKFCYFKVYTEKDSKEVQRYLDALAHEVELMARQPAVRGRTVSFVYFGGGTPSFISARHLRTLVERVTAALPWDQAREITFECEPGTLTEAKLRAIRDIGVTRLSLGVESFDDEILQENGRAHLSAEIQRALPWIAGMGFEQLNIDLIAGMVGETWDSWRDSVRRTLEAAPDSVTIYQMELPFNTVYSRRVLDNGEPVPVADWDTKRAWQAWAVQQMEAAGYEVSSAYTMLRKGSGSRFLYRDALWRGADLLGAGVASFSHVNKVHFQNVSGWEPYIAEVAADRLPLDRAFAPDADERLTRELILQLKLGRIEAGYFREKFAVEVLDLWQQALSDLQSRGMLRVERDGVSLTPEGLMQVDRLLPEFYAPRYRNIRYT